MTLPERIKCDQDIDDIYAHFEHEANHYVFQRLERGDLNDFRGRLFVEANDPRLVSADEIAELKRYLNDGDGHWLWMRAALNEVKRLAQLVGLEYDDHSWIKTQLKKPTGRAALSDLTSSLLFYKPVVEALDLWRRYRNVVTEGYEKRGQDWIDAALDELGGEKPQDLLDTSEGIARLEKLLGIEAK